MRWEKKGRIFTAANQHEWMAHHASVPIPDKVDDTVLRIYFGPRDRQGRTRPAFIDVEADNPGAVGLYRAYGFTPASRDVMYAAG